MINKMSFIIPIIESSIPKESIVDEISLLAQISFRSNRVYSD